MGAQNAALVVVAATIQASKPWALLIAGNSVLEIWTTSQIMA